MSSSNSQAKTPILVAVDLLPHSRSALAYGLQIARESGNPILVLHVVHESGEAPGFYHQHSKSNLITPMAVIAEAMLADLVDEVVAADHIDTNGINVSTMVIEGVPGRRIAEVAEQVNAESIVMVSNGRRGISKVWSGSVEDVVRKYSSRSLVVLRPRASLPSMRSKPATDSVQLAH